MAGEPGPTIGLARSAMFTHWPGTRECPDMPTRRVAVAQPGAMMAARPGYRSTPAATGTIPGDWRLTPTTRTAGMFRRAPDQVLPIEPGRLRPSSIAGGGTAPGRL